MIEIVSSLVVPMGAFETNLCKSTYINKGVVIMNIKNIVIKNFRGFEEQSFDFDPQMNVILGDNTTGKTTLLHAVQVALGAYLQALTLIPSGPYFSRNYQKSDHRKIYNEVNKSFMFAKDKPEIGVKVKVESSAAVTNEIKWKRIGSKNSKKNNGELMEWVEGLEQARRNSTQESNVVLPLLLSFGATRLQNNYNGALKTKSRASREENGYKCALEEKVDFKSAFDWIYNFEKSLARGREVVGNDVAFEVALKTAIPAILDVYIDRKNQELWCEVKMERDVQSYWITYDMMSDGFKSMINIVAEIAYRSIQLNGFKGESAVTETSGIVMIDELDMYLHPRWQRHILADLHRAFPLIQFMVTTHSPFIVQSVEQRNIITLDAETTGESPNRLSLEEVVQDKMNVDTVRSAKYNRMVEMATRYFELVREDKENSDEAVKTKRELDAIEVEFSDDPAYVALLRLERGLR